MESNPFFNGKVKNELNIVSQCLWRVDVPGEVAGHSHRPWLHGVNVYSLKNFKHLEYIYVNVLYISEAHWWPDKHAVSCLFTRYT
jgi:hypothetical protein